ANLLNLKLYKEDHLSGQITVSLSSDSTCSTNLSNSTSGFETLTLQPIPQKRIPPIAEASKYRFPDWMQGRWQRSRVEMQQFIYRDEQNQFRTIRFRCIMRQNDIVNDRFVVHSTTQWFVKDFLFVSHPLYSYLLLPILFFFFKKKKLI
ncbi:hypothetical protein QR98_0075890, partial [Sarcoptes scabiei]